MYFSVCEILSQADTVRVASSPSPGIPGHAGWHRVRAPSRRCRTPLVHILASPLGRGLSRPRQTLRHVGASSTPPLRTSSPACACRLAPGCLLQAQTPLSGPQGPCPRAAGLWRGESPYLLPQQAIGWTPALPQPFGDADTSNLNRLRPAALWSCRMRGRPCRPQLSPFPAPHPPAWLQQPEPRLIAPVLGPGDGLFVWQNQPLKITLGGLPWQSSG